MNSKIIIICGPTAIGKTAFAIKLSKQFDGEIISADSMQVYRYMDIGTAKPSMEERCCVPHHLIDVVDPDEEFDAARFMAEADLKIKEVIARGKCPVIVGGTGFYIKSLMYGLFDNSPHSEKVRASLKEISNIKGCQYLYQFLQKVDPFSAERISANDAYRIIRALEIYHLTGIPISLLHMKHGFKNVRYEALKLCLTENREILYRRINNRVEQMIRDGFIEEIRSLLKMGFGSSLKSMSSIGYKHIAAFVEGNLSLKDAIEQMKRDTRRYAKRQLTWFRKDPNMVWIHPENIHDAVRLIRSFLTTRLHE